MISSNYSVVASDDSVPMSHYTNLLARVAALESRQEREKHISVAAPVTSNLADSQLSNDNTRDFMKGFPGERLPRHLSDVGRTSSGSEVSQCTAFVRELMLKVEQVEKELAQMTGRYKTLQRSFSDQGRQPEILRMANGNDIPLTNNQASAINRLNEELVDRQICTVVDNRMVEWREQILTEVVAVIKKYHRYEKRRSGAGSSNSDIRHGGGGGGGGGGTAHDSPAIEGGNRSSGTPNYSDTTKTPEGLDRTRRESREGAGVSPSSQGSGPFIYHRSRLPYSQPLSESHSHNNSLPPISGGIGVSQPIDSILVRANCKNVQHTSSSSMISVTGGEVLKRSVSFSLLPSVPQQLPRRPSQRQHIRGRRRQSERAYSRLAVLESDIVVVEDNEDNDKSPCSVTDGFTSQLSTTSTATLDLLPYVGLGRFRREHDQPKALDPEVLAFARAEILKAQMLNLAKHLVDEEERRERENTELARLEVPSESQSPSHTVSRKMALCTIPPPGSQDSDEKSPLLQRDAFRFYMRSATTVRSSSTSGIGADGSRSNTVAVSVCSSATLSRMGVSSQES